FVPDTTLCRSGKWKPSVSTIVSAVGRRVRQLRIRAGMTQERLAERAEISVSFLSMIERGERSPHLETLERLAMGLEVPVEALFRPDAHEGGWTGVGDGADGRAACEAREEYR